MVILTQLTPVQEAAFIESGTNPYSPYTAEYKQLEGKIISAHPEYQSQLRNLSAGVGSGISGELDSGYGEPGNPYTYTSNYHREYDAAYASWRASRGTPAGSALAAQVAPTLDPQQIVGQRPLKGANQSSSSSDSSKYKNPTTGESTYGAPNANVTAQQALAAQLGGSGGGGGGSQPTGGLSQAQINMINQANLLFGGASKAFGESTGAPSAISSVSYQTPSGSQTYAMPTYADLKASQAQAQAQQLPDPFTTQYVPYGERTQQELLNTKAAYDPKSGEIGYYQVPINPYTGLPRTGIYGEEAGGMLIGGGSRAAAQSGMFSVGVAGTPDIRTQYNPDKYSERADVALADAIRADPEKYSRLGAEAYFGIVQPLDSRTIQSMGVEYGRFPAFTGNLANLVDPQGANLGKAEYRGADIPWSIPLSSPNLMVMGPEGIVGASPQQAYSREESMAYVGDLWGVGSRAGNLNPYAPQDTLIIGEAEYGFARYGPSIVAPTPDFKAAYPSTPSPTMSMVNATAANVTEERYPTVMVQAPDMSMQPDYMVPYGNTSAVSGKLRGVDGSSGGGGGFSPVTTKPSEEWYKGIPLIGGLIPEGIFRRTSEIDMPISASIARAIAPTITETTGTPYEVSMRAFESKRGGVDYTRQFIGSGNVPTSELTFATGEVISESIATPEGIVTTYAQPQATVNIDKGMVTPTTTTVGESPISTGYKTLKEQVQSYIPTSEKMLPAIKTAELINPYSTPFAVESAITGKPSLGSTLSGGQIGYQYERFREEPFAMPASFAIGVGIGGVVRAGSALYTPIKAAAGSGRVAQGAAVFIEDTAPKLLGGLYAADIGLRSTEGGTKFDVGSVGKAKSIVMQEAVPMGVGYAVPGAAIRAGKISDIGYKSALQEGTAATRFEYYVKQPTSAKASAISDVASTPYRRFQLEYPEFVEQGAGMKGYLSYKLEQTPLPEFARTMGGQSNFVTVERVWPDVTVSPKTPPKTGGESASPLSTIKPPSAPTGSRMTTSIVGGRVRSTLAREPSLKSMGVTETPASVKTTPVGSRTDYRNVPRTTEMPYRKMGMQQVVLTEQLPTVEGMTVGKVAPQQQQSVGMVSFIQPQFASQDIGKQTSLQSEMMVFPTQISSQMFSMKPVQAQEVMQASRQRPFTSTSQALQSETVQSKVESPMRERAGAFDMALAFQQSLDTAAIQNISSTQASRSAIRFDQAQVSILTPAQAQMITPAFDMTSWGRGWVYRTPTPPPALPGIYGGGGAGTSRRYNRKFMETFNIGLDISTFGPGAYNPFGGRSGGAAKRSPARKKSLKRVGKKGGKK